jgi:hypothetical protein
MRALMLFLVLAATPASAETASPPPNPPGAKSEKTAKALVAGGTIFSSGLIIASFLVNLNEGTAYLPTLYAGVGTSIITPSLGQLYAGQYLTIGMGIRGVAAGIALWGYSKKQDQPCTDVPNTNCPTTTATGLVMISLAAIAYIGGVAYDVRDTPNAVSRYNKRLANKRGASLTPTRNGVALVGRF